MYLDNIIKSSQAAPVPEITYSEIMEDTLRMVEVEGAGELALLKAEATKQILGSEAPAEWWSKIKAVARKIFEMLKNLISKVFAFIKTIPDRIAALCNRIATKVVGAGLENKVKALGSASEVEVNSKTFEELKKREFEWFMFGVEGVYDVKSGKGKELVGKIEALDAAIKNASSAIAGLDSKSSDYEEKVQTEKEKVISAKNDVADAERSLKESPYKPFEQEYNSEASILGLAQNLVAYFKNKKYSTSAKAIAQENEKNIREAASTYRKAMSKYEAAVKAEDEEAVKNCLKAAKDLRAITAENAASVARKTRWLSHDVLLATRIAAAGLAALKKKGAKAKEGNK
jgi:hypothetical protein